MVPHSLLFAEDRLPVIIGNIRDMEIIYAPDHFNRFYIRSHMVSQIQVRAGLRREVGWSVLRNRTEIYLIIPSSTHTGRKNSVSS